MSTYPPTHAEACHDAWELGEHPDGPCGRRCPWNGDHQ